jgi:hypothetical protein
VAWAASGAVIFGGQIGTALTAKVVNWALWGQMGWSEQTEQPVRSRLVPSCDQQAQTLGPCATVHGQLNSDCR